MSKGERFEGYTTIETGHIKKEWQGLSDDEILKAIAPKGTADSDWNALKFCDDLITIGRAIQQALKEKNT